MNPLRSFRALPIIFALAVSSCAPTDGIRPAARLINLSDANLITSSRNLAAEAVRSTPFFDQRLDLISDRLLSRELNEAERTYLTGPRDQAAAFYKANPAAARKLVGPLANDASLDPVELATWTVMTSQIPTIDKHMADWGR